MGDKSSLAMEDARRRELKFDGYALEQYGLMHNPSQRWTYFPKMRSDEILMFVQGKCVMQRDAANGSTWEFSLTGDEHPQSVMHTAVLEPGAPAEAQRDSYENRFLVFVPVDEPVRSSL